MDPILPKTVLSDSRYTLSVTMTEPAKESTSEVIFLSKKTSSTTKGIESLLDIDENENLIVRTSDREIYMKNSDGTLPLKKPSPLHSGIPIPTTKKIGKSSVDKITFDKQKPEVKASESSHFNIFDESELDTDSDENAICEETITIEEIEDAPKVQGTQFSQTSEFSVFEIIEPLNDYISQYPSPRPENSSQYIQLTQLAGIFPCHSIFKEERSSKWDEKFQAIVDAIGECRVQNPGDLLNDENKRIFARNEKDFLLHLTTNSGSKAKLIQKHYVEGHLSHPKMFNNAEAQTVTNAMSRMSHREQTKPGEKILIPNVPKTLKKPPVEKNLPVQELFVIKKSPPRLAGSSYGIHSPAKKNPLERKKTAMPKEIDNSNDDKTTGAFQSAGYRAKHMMTKGVPKKPAVKPISSPKANLTYGGRVMAL